MTRINISELGKLLTAAFDGSNLETLAFDIDMELYGNINHLAKSKKVIEIISFSAQQGKLDKVIAFAKANNPYQYSLFEPVLFEQSSAATAGNTPVADNANREIESVVTELAGVMKAMVEKGMGDQITINSIGNVAEGGVVAQGDGATAVGGRGVNVGGANSGTVITGDGNIVGNNNKQQNITFGDGANISGNFNAVAADSIENSFNTIEQSDGSDEIKTLLKTLLQSVEQAAKEAENQEDAEDLVDRSKKFADEALKKKPDEEDARYSLKRLTKAAENIGKLAAPVTIAAKAVLRALGFAI